MGTEVEMKKLAWYKEPLFHFFIVGAFLFLLYSLVPTSDEDDAASSVVHVRGDMLETLVEIHADETGALPDAGDLTERFRDYLRLEMLYQEAVSMGLAEVDLEIRRHLAGRLASMIGGESVDLEPSTAELAALYEERKQGYSLPEQVSFLHWYFAPRADEEQAAAHVRGVLDELSALPDPQRADLEGGDPFPGGNARQNLNAWELKRDFGAAFAEEVLTLEPGQWSGPIPARDGGQHLVLVTETTPAHIPAFEDVRERVRRDWVDAEIRESAQSREYRRFQAVYEFAFEDTARALLEEYGIDPEEILP